MRFKVRLRTREYDSPLEFWTIKEYELYRLGKLSIPGIKEKYQLKLNEIEKQEATLERMRQKCLSRIKEIESKTWKESPKIIWKDKISCIDRKLARLSQRKSELHCKM